jgi:hypothetical protein
MEIDMRNYLIFLVGLCVASVLSCNVSATMIKPVVNGWYALDVDELVAQDASLGWIDGQLDDDKGYVGDGSVLSFAFTLTKSSVLTVVDAGIAGDEFGVLVNGVAYVTSAVAAYSDEYAGTDFDAALLNSGFSRLSLILDAGSYTVSGFLYQSAIDPDGAALNATIGGLRIVEADESGILILWSIAGGGLLWARRKSVVVNVRERLLWA